MTTKIIELKEAPVVLVELPENSNNHRIESLIGMYRMDYLVHDTPHENNVSFRLPVGVKYNVVGSLSDLTEEQFAECVDVYEVSESINIPKMRFYQMLESENVYTENPYGATYKKMLESGMNYKNFLEWHEAQSRTIDPKRTVVLLRKEEKKFKEIKEEVIKETAIKSWEDDAKYNPIPNNPYAYCSGFKAGCKEVIEHPERYGLTNKAPEMLDFINRISAEMLRSDFVLSEKWYDQAQELIKKSTEL